MLIPNKFNGYQADGCRLLSVGGGVGEAALLGAAMGGGSAALTGGDPLKGALLGGLTGGIGGGIGGVTAGTAGGVEAGLMAGAQGGGAGAAAGTTAATAAPTAAGTAAAPITTAAGAGVNTGGISPFMATNPVAAGTSPFASSSGIDAIMRNAAASGTPATGAAPTAEGTFMEGMQRFIKDPIASIKRNPFPAGISALAGATGARKEDEMPSNEYDGPLKRFRYSPDTYRPQFAEGGIASLTSMPVERMSDRNDTMAMMASRGQMYAQGGISSLGSYSDGGRMLKGPGDGMSDSIPASIAGKRPARLATEEFVVPADVVSHLGNGSSDAGAKQLYAMMDRVRSARTGTKKQGRQIRPQSMMPA